MVTPARSSTSSSTGTTLKRNGSSQRWVSPSPVWVNVTDTGSNMVCGVTSGVMTICTSSSSRTVSASPT